jgi:hypothetical protein
MGIQPMFLYRRNIEYRAFMPAKVFPQRSHCDCMINDPLQTASPSLRDLPCDVQLTPEVVQRFFRSGVSPTSPDEQRRFVRFYCGNQNNRLGVRYLPSVDSIERDTNWRGGIPIDVSRGGLQFLHSEEVFPGEKVRIALESKATLQVFKGEVAWCRRHARKCFGVGIRFLQSTPDIEYNASDSVA